MVALVIPPCPPGHKITFAVVNGERRLVAVEVTADELAARQRHREEVAAADRRSRERRARWFELDWRACIALENARRAENAERRRKAQASPSLCAALLKEARQRGQSEIDWPEYFRNTYI